MGYADQLQNFIERLDANKGSTSAYISQADNALLRAWLKDYRALLLRLSGEWDQVRKEEQN